MSNGNSLLPILLEWIMYINLPKNHWSLKEVWLWDFFPPDNHLFGHSRSSSQRCREPTQDGSRLRSQTFVLWRPPKVDECKYSMWSMWPKRWSIVSEELCRLCYCFFWCGWTSSSCMCRMTELSHRQPNPAFYSGTYGESQCVLF